MTAPVLSVPTANGRFYQHPARNVAVPSITNVIGMKDKPGLKHWAAKMAAGYAADNLAKLATLERDEAFRLIKGAPFVRRDDSPSAIGDIVHNWIDEYVKGGGQPDTSAAPWQAIHMWRQFGHFVQRYQPRWLDSEFTVWSNTHNYAGTMDLAFAIGNTLILADTKCMTPETLITMADGTERPAGAVHHGDFVAAWNGREVIPARVRATGDNGIRPVYRIGTLCGRSLTVTEEHPILTRDGWVKAAHVQEGAFVVVAGAAPAENGMAADDAYLIGLVCGDGGLSSGVVKITATDELVVAFLRDYTAARGLRLSLDGEITYTMVGATGRVVPNPVTQMFREMGLLGTKSGTKFVPDAVLSGGREAWLHFLAGYLDSDGCIRTASQGGWCVSWVSKSERMARQCQSILTGLGVRARVNPVRGYGKYSSNVYWKLTVGDRAAVRALQAILPFRGARARRLSQSEIPAVTRTAAQATPNGYDRITSVEPLIARPTVWIEVEGLHTHITSGIVTHNTGERVYPETAMQLAAGARADFILTPEGEEKPLYKFERFAVLHVRPRSYALVPVEKTDEAWQAFLALRTVFAWHVNHADSTLGFAPRVGSKG